VIQRLVEVIAKDLRNFDKYGHLKNFFVIVPALSINFVEYMLTCKVGDCNGPESLFERGRAGRQGESHNTFR
jgi:hypothetical protein